MSMSRLKELMAQFDRCRIAVMGDFFLDKYLDVDPSLEELSVETGLRAHQVVNVRCSPGAAGTVVRNLAALGAGTVRAIGFTGDDGEAYELRKALADLRCGTDHVHCVPALRTPTYLKPRDVRDQSLKGEHSRYDTKNRRETPDEVQAALIESLEQVVSQVDAVIVMDQIEERDCGAITGKVREALGAVARRHPSTLFWADSRSRIREFSGVTIKPNQFEAVGKSNPLPGEEVQGDELLDAARKLRAANQAPLVITRGAAGMLVSDPEWTVVPGVPVVGDIDPTGAGDSVSAGAVLALCAGAQWPEAALVGNLVASITIRQIGTTGVAYPDQLTSALEAWHQRASEINEVS
ncbi:MAG: PfkB family carbohydrate kinase [Pirellulaceae bacterium]